MNQVSPNCSVSTATLEPHGYMDGEDKGCNICLMAPMAQYYCAANELFLLVPSLLSGMRTTAFETENAYNPCHEN